MVVGVPDSGLDAAIGYAGESGSPMPWFYSKQSTSAALSSLPRTSGETGVNIKLNPIRPAVEGKRVVLIDDSIVRGTTCRQTIQLLWGAGAREVHMRVSAPAFVAPCYYGTDIDSPENLIANQHSVEEIAELIGVNSGLPEAWST